MVTPELPFPVSSPARSRRRRSLYQVAAGALVAALCLPLVVLLRQNLRRILLAAILLDLAFVIDVNVRYRQETALFGAIEGFNLSLTTAALVGLYASWVIGFLAREPSTPRRVRMNGALAVYLGFVALSMSGAWDLELAQFELFMLLQVFLVHVYIASTVRTRADILFLVSVLFVGLVVQALMILATIAMGRDFAIGSINAQRDPMNGRAAGTFGSPILVASYLALLLAPSVGLVLARVSRSLRALAVVAFVLGTISLIFTQSRGAWISLALSMSLLGFAAWRRGYFSLRTPLLLAAGVMLLALPFSGVIAERLQGDDHGSAHSRIPLAILATRVITDHPWLGVGPNNFALIEQRYVTSEFVGEWFYVAHNKYLLVWAETGVGALLAFILFLGTTLRQGWRQWRAGDPVLAPLALGFTAAIVGHMEHMFVDVFHSRPQVQTLWTISALIVAMSNVKADS